MGLVASEHGKEREEKKKKRSLQDRDNEEEQENSLVSSNSTARNLDDIPVVVPTGHLWVEGEHPEGDRRSYDSNTYGPVSRSLVVGRVMGVVWPWAKAGRIRWEDWVGNERVKVGAGAVERYELFEA